MMLMKIVWRLFLLEIITPDEFVLTEWSPVAPCIPIGTVN